MTILQVVLIFIAGLIAGIAVTLMAYISEIAEYQKLRAKYDDLEHELIWYKTNSEKLCDIADTLFNITDTCIDKQFEKEEE